jgi:hypothetical protein
MFAGDGKVGRVRIYNEALRVGKVQYGGVRRALGAVENEVKEVVRLFVFVIYSIMDV